MKVLMHKGAYIWAECQLDGRTYDALSLAAHFGFLAIIIHLIEEDVCSEKSLLRALFTAVDAGQSEALTCIIDCLPAKTKIPYHKGSEHVYSSKDVAKQNLMATIELIQGQKLTGVTPQITVTKINPPLAPLYAAVASGEISKKHESC